MEIYSVVISKNAYNDLPKVPKHVVFKLQTWVELVGNAGLGEARKIKGFHDEPLVGNRRGQRSIRLNRAYRAIYEIDQSHVIHFIEIIEVTKHDYKSKS